MRTPRSKMIIRSSVGHRAEHPVCLVILLLLAHEDESHLRVVYHELYLLLTACGVERNRHGPHAISAEVGIEIFHAVL